jgi:hypothetical protein
MLNGRVRCGPMSGLPSSMDRRVIGERSDAVLQRLCPAMTRFFVLAMRLRIRALPTPRKAKPKSIPKKHRQETPPLKEGRRSAERRTTGPHRKAMRRASFLLPPFYGGTEAAGTSWSGRARLSAPHRGIRGFFGLGSAQAALPGTTGCKREDPLRHQCSEHLAVRHAPDGTMPKPPASAVYRYARREPLPLRPKEYPRERRPFVERDFG